MDFAKIVNEKRLQWLAIAIIIAGVVLRAAFYFQNRCLFIDEANVARNIYERGFLGLTMPLSYEQYAPPLFLWIIKLFTLTFGFGELACRAYPFVCGIASLPLFYAVLKKITSVRALWYPLFILATGFIYIRYSAELKQYMSDVVVLLALILLALKQDILITARARFCIVWCIAGSIAIWLSMPAVFMLSGVGAYYFYQVITARRYARLWPLALMAAVWMVQFLLYYVAILKPQANSTYLQSCHKEFFLYFTPLNNIPWAGNINALDKFIEATGGKWVLSVVFNLVTFFVGVCYLFRHQRPKLILLIVPVLALLLAAAAQQYALTPRLVLFMMPVLLIFIGAGLQAILKFLKIWLSLPVLVVACICIFNFSSFSLLWQPVQFEEILPDIAFLRNKNINGTQICVHNLAVPAFVYYTTIHPSKDKWKDLQNATFLYWNTNYDSLAKAQHGRWALLYSWLPDEEFNAQQAQVQKYFKVTDQNTVFGGKALIYDAK